MQHPAHRLATARGGNPAVRLPYQRRSLVSVVRNDPGTVDQVVQPVEQQPEPVQQVVQPYAPYQHPYQQQMAPPHPQQYYVAAPPVPPTYPVAPYGTVEASSPIPWWVWMGAGILVANVMRLVQEVMKKGPQAMMAEMAMKQMMKGMGQPGAPGGAGANPFAAMAGMPGMPGGQPPFPGGQPPYPYGNANPFAPGFAPSSPAVDTTATPVSGGGGATAAAAAPPRGEKFAQRVGAEKGPAEAPSAPHAANGSTAATAAAAAAPPAPEVVEAAEVKEPLRQTSTSSSAGAPSGGFSFTDVTVDAGNGASTSAPGAGAASAASFFAGAAAGGAGAGAGGAAAGAGAGAVGQDQMTAMMDKMLRDPNMQRMLYPYLPEPMRNPESFEWMLNNPEVRKQMESVFAQGGMSPQMMGMMQQMDFSQETVQAQFSALGLKPEDVIQKVMASPELASGFANPKVQQAFFDVSQNPMNITKYQNDPEVMAVMEKVTEIFGPNVQTAQQQ